MNTSQNRSTEIPIESVQHVRTGEPVAKAKSRTKPIVTWSAVSIPIHERKWTDIDPKTFNQGYFAVSKFMIRLL